MANENHESIRKEKYQRLVNERMPKSDTLAECLRAFVSGGAICSVGQLVRNVGTDILLLSEEHTAAFTAIVMVFLGALLTGLGVYDKIGSWAGAGSIVPITGFANSVVSPAMEFKREGFITGTAVKLFTIAGPVLVYGIIASVAVGIVYSFFM